MNSEPIDTRRGVYRTRTMMTPYLEVDYRLPNGTVISVRTAKRSFHRMTSKYMPHQGALECERRAKHGPRRAYY